LPDQTLKNLLLKENHDSIPKKNSIRPPPKKRRVLRTSPERGGVVVGRGEEVGVAEGRFPPMGGEDGVMVGARVGEIFC